MRYNRYFADTSSAQPDVNMHDYADAGHLLIAIKATEGVDYVNPYHRGQCLAAGGRHVAVCHYHFARPDQGNAPDMEAEHFWSAVDYLAGPYDYLTLDLERATPNGWKHDPLWSSEFDATIRSLSRFRTILYANRSTLESGEGWLTADPKRVHDADWSTRPDYAPPGYECVFRQFTDGVVGPQPQAFAGIGRCDGNYMAADVFNHLRQYR